MKLNLNKINREDFLITEKEGLYLILPKRSKYIWEEDELHLRSLLCTVDGTVVSSGFPKFMNYGEFPENDKKLDQAQVITYLKEI